MSFSGVVFFQRPFLRSGNVAGSPRNPSKFFPYALEIWWISNKASRNLGNHIAIENGPVEIVDFPIDSMVIFHSYVNVLPEGIGNLPYKPRFFGDGTFTSARLNDSTSQEGCKATATPQRCSTASAWHEAGMLWKP